jgi:hypothetical protein
MRLPRPRMNTCSKSTKRRRGVISSASCHPACEVKGATPEASASKASTMVLQKKARAD